MAHVLVLDGDARQCLPVMKALRAGGHEVTVACESRISMGWMSRYPNHRTKVPSVENEPEEFLGALLSLVRSGNYDVTLPLFDLCAHQVAKNKPELTRHTRVPLVDYEVFMLARDKARTMKICRDAGVPHPRTWYPEEEDLEEIGGKVTYPVLVKPRIAHGARGIVRVEGAGALVETHARIQERWGPCIVQELIPQTDIQYKAQLFRDSNGSYRAGVVFNKLRYFPVSGGTSSINVTVDREDILASGRRLLDAMNWRGYADLDYIHDPRDSTAKVMEVNPRVTGSVKIAFEAGVDFADLLVRDALDQPLPRYDGYVLGLTMRYLPLDVLWFLFSPDRFSAEPNWFRFFGTNLCYQVLSVRDPGPFLALLIGGVRRLLNPSVREAKFGG